MNPNKAQLYELVANALGGKPSEQPVHKNAGIGEVGKNDQKKVKNSISAGFKQKQKGSPNKSYSVAVINKAQAKLG